MQRLNLFWGSESCSRLPERCGAHGLQRICGASVVYSGSMNGARMVTGGPYRRTRNPLYLGLMLHTVALSLLMPPSGAVVAVVLIFLFDLRLALGEESFLSEKLGEPYRGGMLARFQDYCLRFVRGLRQQEQSQHGSWLF